LIRRESKGLEMVFHCSHIVKSYGVQPTVLSVEDRDQRFLNEVAAYQRFGELGCPFVPELLDFSIDGRWLSIARIRGGDLLALSQSQGFHVPIGSILAQIDQMNEWLRRFSFGDMGNNIKDLILDERGRLYLVDFEPYSADVDPDARPDIYTALVYDILERVMVRTQRAARLTSPFVALALRILLRRPAKSVWFACRILARRVYGWIRREGRGASACSQ
jgi:hypothetical protein